MSPLQYWWERWWGVLALAGIFLVIGIFQADRPFGPVEAHQGIVVSLGVDASSQYRLPEAYAEVRILGGKIVNAKVQRGVAVVPGSNVEVAVFQRLITRGKEYAVVERLP